MCGRALGLTELQWLWCGLRVEHTRFLSSFSVHACLSQWTNLPKKCPPITKDVLLMPPLELIIIWKNQSRFTPTVLVLIMLDDNWIHEFLGTYYTSVRLCSRYASNAGKNACLAIGYYIFERHSISS